MTFAVRGFSFAGEDGGANLILLSAVDSLLALTQATRLAASHPAPRIWPRLTATCLGVLVACLGSCRMWAADLAAPEYQVKAAFLLNLAKFTDWPPPSPGESAGSFVIGVLGEDPFRNALEDVLKGQTLKGRKLVLRRLQAVDDASACHLLFISRSEKDRLPALLIALEKKSVLTISDFEGFCQRGGMINLMVSGDGTIKPEINPEAARAAGLQFSSKLLKLPTIRIASTVTAP